MRKAIMHILLLVALCLWCHTQSTEGRKCSGPYSFACASNNKRSDIIDVAKVFASGTYDGRPDRRGAREEGRGGYGGGDEAEVDDLQRSEFNDHRRQLSEERQLSNIGNHQQHPAPLHDDSVIGRLRALLGTRAMDLDHREAEEKREQRQEEEEEEEEQEEETERRSISDTDKNLILDETMTLLEKILGDIENRLDAGTQPAPHSVNKK